MKLEIEREERRCSRAGRRRMAGGVEAQRVADVPPQARWDRSGLQRHAAAAVEAERFAVEQSLLVYLQLSRQKASSPFQVAAVAAGYGVEIAMNTRTLGKAVRSMGYDTL